MCLTDPVGSAGGTRGIVVESNESNNSRASAVPMLIDLPPPTDLQVDSVVVPSNATVGSSVSVGYTESNHGDQPATGIWTDGVYLSSDAVWDYGDIQLGTVTPDLSAQSRAGAILYRHDQRAASANLAGQLPDHCSGGHFQRHQRGRTQGQQHDRLDRCRDGDCADSDGGGANEHDALERPGRALPG